MMPGVSSLRCQLLLILVIRCMRMALIAQPVIVVWFVDHLQVSVSGMFWLTSLGSAFTVLAEIPSGYISDRLGRKHTMLCAFVAMACAYLCAALAPHCLWLLVLFQILKGVGSALFSGTDMALLYEMMSRHGHGKGDDALAQESLHIFAIQGTESAVAVLGGLVAQQFGVQAVVFAAVCPFCLGAMLCAIGIHELPPPRQTAEGGRTRKGSELDDGQDKQGAQGNGEG